MEEYTTKVIIKYFPQYLTQDEILPLFTLMGEVESYKVKRSKVTGESLGYGFVNYHRTEDAKKAVNILNGLRLQNKTIKVSFARPYIEGIEWTNLHINGIPKNMVQPDLENLFSPYGYIIYSKLISDRITGLSKGYGFVRYTLRSEAERAIQALHGLTPKGSTVPVTVRFANNSGNNKAIPSFAAYLAPQAACRFGSPIHHPTGCLRYPLSPLSSSGKTMLGINRDLRRYSPLAGVLLANSIFARNTMNRSGWCIVVYNLDPEIEEIVLWQLFGTFGAVQSVKIIKDPLTGLCIGSGCVTMTDYHEAIVAVQFLNDLGSWQLGASGLI